MRRLRFILVLCVALLTAGPAAQAPAPSPPQTGAPPALAAGRRRSAAADILPFKATETTLANGLEVIVVPTGFPNLVAHPDPRADRIAQRDRARQVGLRALLRAPDVPRHADYAARQYQRDHGKAGARENASTGDDFTRFYATFAKEDLETMLATYADMFQHLAVLRRRTSRPRRARFSASTTRTAPTRSRSSSRSSATRFYQAHTYKHTTMGFIADIENMPNEYAVLEGVLRALVPAAVHDASSSPATWTPEQVLPLVEKYWGGWKAGTARRVDISRRSRRRRAARTSTCRGPRHAAVGLGRLPGPAFDETSKDYGGDGHARRSVSAPTSDLYKRLVVAEQKVDELDADSADDVDPSLFTVLARVKNPADAVYVRDQILRPCARAARQRPGRCAALAEAKSYNRYEFARTLDSTERIAGRAGRVRALRAARTAPSTTSTALSTR